MKRRLAPMRVAFAGRKAAELDAAAWDRYVAERRRRAVSNATLNRARGYLSRDYTLGLERGKVARPDQPLDDSVLAQAGSYYGSLPPGTGNRDV